MRAKWMLRDLARWTSCLVIAAAMITAGCSSDSSQRQSPDTSDEIRDPEVVDEPSGEMGESEQPAPTQQQPPASGDQGMAEQPGQQGPPGQQAPQGQQAQQPSEEKIDAFVDTYEEIVELEQDYRQRISQAEGQQEMQALQAEAQQEVQQTIDEGDLSRQEFLSIMQQMQRDVELRQRIDQKLRQDG